MYFKIIFISALLGTMHTKAMEETKQESPSAPKLSPQSVIAWGMPPMALPSPRKGLRRTLTIDELRAGCIIRNNIIYSVKGTVFRRIIDEKESLIIGKRKYTAIAGETLQALVLKVLRRKQQSKELIEKVAIKRQELLAKRRADRSAGAGSASVAMVDGVQ